METRSDGRWSDAEKSDCDVVVFDGECNLCNGWVRFVSRRDPSGRFRFETARSEFSRGALFGHDNGGDLNSIVLLQGGRAYFKSTAVLKILRRLQGAWPLLSALFIIPEAIRDFVYDIVARNRYRWFGGPVSCTTPASK